MNPMWLIFVNFQWAKSLKKLLQLGPTFVFQVVLTRKKPRKTWLLNGYNIYQVGMCCFIRSESAIISFPRRCTPPSLQCQLPLSHWLLNFQKTKKTQKARGKSLDVFVFFCFLIQFQMIQCSFQSKYINTEFSRLLQMIHIGLQSYLWDKFDHAPNKKW